MKKRPNAYACREGVVLEPVLHGFGILGSYIFVIELVPFSAFLFVITDETVVVATVCTTHMHDSALQGILATGQ